MPRSLGLQSWYQYLLSLFSFHREWREFKTARYVLVVHGGSGAMQKNSSPEKQEKYRVALRNALEVGYAVLSNGGEAMDVAVAAVSSLEDCPLFNSGRGAVFNLLGKNELEASIMLSKPPASSPTVPANRRGISITQMTRPRNPIKLARALYLEPSLAPHAMLSGSTAEDLGIASAGIEVVDPSYFFTEPRWREHRGELGVPEEPLPYGFQSTPESAEMPLDFLPKGTVGAVALDERGCIACATSTGGKTNKLVGRIGDTPIMGCGFWAEEFEGEGWWTKIVRRILGKGKRAVGISCTGDGDFFIRRTTATAVAYRMKYLNESLTRAAHHVVKELGLDGGLGGLIALDEQGTVAMPLNCPGMYRGVIRMDGVPRVAIFDHEQLHENARSKYGRRCNQKLSTSLPSKKNRLHSHKFSGPRRRQYSCGIPSRDSFCQSQ